MRPKAPVLELAPRPKPAPSPLLNKLRKLVGAAGLLLVMSSAVACRPPTPAQKASEAARELNLAARWGKMEEAVGRSAPEGASEFMERRSTWHNDVRIVETELAGLNMKDATHAIVQVDVSWNFADDPTLRVTRLEQEWTDKGKWMMVKEERKSGDIGLFGEEVKREEKKRDKHFPTRVIH